MKKIIVLAATAMLVQLASAQVKEGTIIYEEKIDLHRRIPKENEQMRSMVPQFRTSQFDLLFADNKSLYKIIEEEPDLSEQPQNGVVMRFGGNDNIFYKDFTAQLSVEKRNLMEKEFLVEDSIRNVSWKLVDGETKTVAGHACKKATGKSLMGLELVAWYAEDMNLPAGPAQFSGLPGLILALDVNQGEIVYVAKEIKTAVKKAEIKAPAKGKKVTPAEFAKVRKEVMGEGNGPVRIVTN